MSSKADKVQSGTKVAKSRLPSNERFNFGVYEIGAHKNRVLEQRDSGLLPGVHPNIRVYNIGRYTVLAEILYGTLAAWIGPIQERTILPGDEAVLNNGGRVYYFTGCRVYNMGDLRALVQCVPVDGYLTTTQKESNYEIDIDINDLMKTLVVFGVGKIPVVGEYLTEIIAFFWPDSEDDVWEEIKDKVESMIDTKTMEAIQGILGGDMRRYKERIIVLETELEDKISKLDIANHYMNIAEDLIGLEKKFIFSKKDNSNYENINYSLLPLYSAIISMKMAFYRIGIINKDEIGLNADHIKRLKNYGNRLIEDENGAVNYITKISKAQVDKAYEKTHPENVFDGLATARTYVGINGLEYIPVWRGMLDDPFSKKKAYVDVVTYSAHFGRPTPKLTRQLIPEEVPAPLQPKLVDGKRLKLIAVQVFIWRHGVPKIGGIRVTFENGDYYTMGSTSSDNHVINLEGAYIKELQVWGDGALDCLKFTISDGRVLSYGTIPHHGINYTFKAQYHHIASIYVSNDVDGLGGQAGGIAVSYLITPESE